MKDRPIINTTPPEYTRPTSDALVVGRLPNSEPRTNPNPSPTPDASALGGPVRDHGDIEARRRHNTGPLQTEFPDVTPLAPQEGPLQERAEAGAQAGPSAATEATAGGGGTSAATMTVGENVQIAFPDGGEPQIQREGQEATPIGVSEAQAAIQRLRGEPVTTRTEAMIRSLQGVIDQAVDSGIVDRAILQTPAEEGDINMRTMEMGSMDVIFHQDCFGNEPTIRLADGSGERPMTLQEAEDALAQLEAPYRSEGGLQFSPGEHLALTPGVPADVQAMGRQLQAVVERLREEQRHAQ